MEDAIEIEESSRENPIMVDSHIKKKKIDLCNTCEVCGDASSGRHYTVFSCEGCKAFFKRSVGKNMKYTCQFEERCIIDKETRGNCQFCRLKKCFSSGMLKDRVKPMEKNKNIDKNYDDSLHDETPTKKRKYCFAEGVFPCDKCDCVYNTKSKLYDHRKYHKPKRFSCTMCQKTFYENHDLQLHIRVHTGEKPFKCNVCDYMCSSSSYATVHMRTHTGVRPFKCEICQQTFTRKTYLNAHIMKKHLQKKIERKFACEICDSKFTTEIYLSSHMVIHTKDQQFPCTICDKTFLRPGNLKQHMASHNNERSHVCKICQKSFKLPSHLNTHMKTHGCDNEDEIEPGQPSYSFECDICGKKYKTELHYKSHKLEQHYKDVAEEKDVTKYNYYCETCEKQFKTKIGYNKHIAALHNKDEKK